MISLYDKETAPSLAAAQRSCSWACTDAWRSRASPASLVRSDTLKIEASLTVLSAPATSKLAFWPPSDFASSAIRRERKYQTPVSGWHHGRDIRMITDCVPLLCTCRR